MKKFPVVGKRVEKMTACLLKMYPFRLNVELNEMKRRNNRGLFLANSQDLDVVKKGKYSKVSYSNAKQKLFFITLFCLSCRNLKLISLLAPFKVKLKLSRF